jgi:hypothetical protein
MHAPLRAIEEGRFDPDGAGGEMGTLLVSGGWLPVNRIGQKPATRCQQRFHLAAHSIPIRIHLGSSTDSTYARLHASARR